MDMLPTVLMLLAASVVSVILCRSINQPPVLGYLLVGTLIGPHALDLVGGLSSAQHLAEFGVVFLMFSIGLEFSLPKLHAMRRTVFGLGLLQVLLTIAVVSAIALAAGLGWQAGVALGGALAMSSTAVLSRLLSERMELDSPHGREVMGVLLFQDLAVVPLLILIPAFAHSPERMAMMLGLAAVKAVLALSIVLVIGQRVINHWFFIVARSRSAELFMLNVLLITLGLSWLTELAGLSLALGSFIAGILISETQYRHQVEEDIKPFRDVLMGLFFITIGMMLDAPTVVGNAPLVVGILASLLGLKFALVLGLSRLFGTGPGNAMRTALWLCTGGEFGFVMLSEMAPLELAPAPLLQAVLAALVLSMLVAPLIVQYSNRLVLRFASSEWLLRSMQITRLAAQTMNTSGHVVICGYGRSGQHLARFMEQEAVPYVALDLDPERVREAAAAGENVSYGDATRRETLLAAGVSRARVLITSFADPRTALRVLEHVRAINASLPVIARTLDEKDMAALQQAGAAEVVPETLEASMVLAAHALSRAGVPVAEVLERFRKTRSGGYRELRGFFRGSGDAEESSPEDGETRLHSVVLVSGAHAVGRSPGELGLAAIGVEVTAVRRRNIRALEPSADIRFETGDVIVLLGGWPALSAAEERLLKG
ncbi:monovalent cation:proton antiporter family protein [Accumulibacter sp.]|uniref:monovalent cation:proton antiporter family protein n=1 Tax=Accumulibacter sp. TaxID=2053492 RepID=UPI0025DFB27E|nr:monovalent cation:proton antiporter family protein [Accumulibacter sp.]MCM8594741.1 monovalent cation:proton antiporter-2 (CPA2) family protein [Accumulibacter sp.]MCM8625842.1 monovalent cation:proton antiporter-2 (CPA2) family protein [Accumulibacter sp.]MDS4048887.1 monovalent cation:proton antiporter-2 (CPA2) family protein [Accumulibacter sp.]